MLEVPLVSIIIPTYNERDNLEPLLERIDKALSPVISYEAIIVDDDSPDGTAAIAGALSNRYPVRVIVRRNERGLAPAVVEGFKAATGSKLVVIDADLQHPPEAISLLIDGLEKGADIAISSRYVSGGNISRWGRVRRWSSRFAALSARLVIPAVRDIGDPLSGFFALDKNVLIMDEMKPKGYKVLLEVLATARYQKVVEVPYTFADRTMGETKYDLREMANYGRHLLGLARRTGELSRVLKFMLVGTSGIAVNEGLLYVLTEYGGLFYLLSSVIAVQCAILNNFTWNHLWTFRDRRRLPHSLLRRLGKFELVSIGGKVTNIAVLYLLVTFAGMQYLIANLFGIAAGFVVNFLANNLWTWRR
jgi:dolichol-phosphate mannosyltransferase